MRRAAGLTGGKRRSHDVLMDQSLQVLQREHVRSSPLLAREGIPATPRSRSKTEIVDFLTHLRERRPFCPLLLRPPGLLHSLLRDSPACWSLASLPPKTSSNSSRPPSPSLPSTPPEKPPPPPTCLDIATLQEQTERGANLLYLHT